MHRIIWAILSLVGMSVAGATWGQDPSGWKDLASFRPATEVQKAVQKRGPTWTVHRIEDGSGEINLDYYPILVTELPVMDGRRITPNELLAYIRLHLNDFVDGDEVSFAPHADEDKERWNDEDPDGALLLIDIKLVDNAVVKATDLALVVTSMNSSASWTFSTVRGGSGWDAVNDRGNPGAHPVSGNREFGFERNGEAWTFYTRGADRATRPMDRFWGVPGAKDIGFEQADRLWRGFQVKVAEYVNQNGGKAKVEPESAVANRFDWEKFESDKQNFDTTGQPPWNPVPEP